MTAVPKSTATYGNVTFSSILCTKMTTFSSEPDVSSSITMEPYTQKYSNATLRQRMIGAESPGMQEASHTRTLCMSNEKFVDTQSQPHPPGYHYGNIAVVKNAVIEAAKVKKCVQDWCSVDSGQLRHESRELL